MSECNLCGFPVGSDACNAQHFTAEEVHKMQTAPVKKPKPKRNDFIRGYCCAVANLINMHGCGTEATELFRGGGKKEDIVKHADDVDQATFREHGLLP